MANEIETAEEFVSRLAKAAGSIYSAPAIALVTERDARLAAEAERRGAERMRALVEAAKRVVKRWEGTLLSPSERALEAALYAMDKVDRKETGP